MFSTSKGKLNYDFVYAANNFLELVVENTTDNTIVSSGVFSEAISHSGVIDIPFYKEISASATPFIVVSGVRFIDNIWTTQFLSLPEWEVSSFSFYPVEDSVWIKVETTEQTTLQSKDYISASGMNEHIFAANNILGQTTLSMNFSCNDENLTENKIIFPLPSLSFSMNSYHELFLKASETVGFQSLIEKCFAAIKNIPLSSVFAADDLDLSKLLTFQQIVLKFLMQYPTPELFIKRFSLWFKYQNLDLETPFVGEVLSQAQKIALLILLQKTVGEIVFCKINNEIKEKLENMNSYLMIPSGSPIRDIYTNLFAAELSPPPVWDVAGAVSFVQP